MWFVLPCHPTKLKSSKRRKNEEEEEEEKEKTHWQRQHLGPQQVICVQINKCGRTIGMTNDNPTSTSERELNPLYNQLRYVRIAHALLLCLDMSPGTG